MLAKIIRIVPRPNGVILIVVLVITGLFVLEPTGASPIWICIGIVLLAAVGIRALDFLIKRQIQSRVDGAASQKGTVGLSELLIDNDWRVREAAAKALEQIGVPDSTMIRARYMVAKKEFALAASLGTVSVEPLVLALNHPDTMVRTGYANALALIGDARAVQPLIEAVNGLDPRAIINIANALGQFKDPRAVDQLIAALQNPRDSVRWVAAYALGEIGDPKALPELERVAREDKGDTYDDGPVKDAAREAAGKIRWHERPMEELIAGLTDPDSETRYYAADALGKSVDARIVEPLIAVLHDPSQKVREAAVRALGETRDMRAIDPLMAIVTSRDDTLIWDAVNAMQRIAGPPVEALVVLLADAHPYNRLAAIKRLGETSDPRALSALKRVVQEERSRTQDTTWNIGDEARKAIEDIRRRMKNE